jgi:hypothetical protein
MCINHFDFLLLFLTYGSGVDYFPGENKLLNQANKYSTTVSALHSVAGSQIVVVPESLTGLDAGK